MIIAAATFSTSVEISAAEKNFYSVEKFADLEILRYKVPGFEDLTPKQKELVYYLSQAALQGRDILYDQNGKWNLAIRRTLEAVYTQYKGDRNSKDFKALEKYLKQVWFANGIHHHYSTDKFKPEFSQNFFVQAVSSIPAQSLPLKKGESIKDLLNDITPVMFNPKIMTKRVNQTEGEDLVATSAGNYYDGVTQAEAEAFYNNMKNPAAVAENDQQKAVIEKLISYNKSGDLKEFDEYAILWVGDLNSDIDFVNGFTETYGDPLGMKASWEALVNFKNKEASRRTEIISNNAQWFESNSPVDNRFKKENVKGVSAKVITAAILGGDSYPSTAIGINLPNSNWIRHDHGSKSVTIENITDAYDKAAQGNGFAEEFVWSDTERNWMEKYGFQADNLHTDLHECLGHASGKLLPGTDPDALKAYTSTLEEARADLFALYYIADPKIVSLGLLPTADAYKSEYYKYMMNGLMTQLTRIAPGKNIEEAHMRNRQLIAAWVLEKGAQDKVVEFKKKNGKTFVVINDYDKMRTLLGELLAEIQRIKSTGDYEAGKNLVETYAVKVDLDLHKEVLARYEKLNIAPYKGFINPVYTPVKDSNGNITDVKISYDEGYSEQMLRYSKDYSPLPTYND